MYSMLCAQAKAKKKNKYQFEITQYTRTHTKAYNNQHICSAICDAFNGPREVYHILRKNKTNEKKITSVASA